MKKILLILFSFGLMISTHAQQGPFGWRIGVGAGYTNYYGDLSNYRLDSGKDWKNVANIWHVNLKDLTNTKKMSYAIFLERKLSNTIGLLLSFQHLQFGANDRLNLNNEVDMKNTNFNRGLNFQNKMNDLGLAFVFKTDNDRILGNNALIAPYFTLGAGINRFKVYGDLYTADSNRYYYYNDGSIHTNSPSDPIPSAAISQDGVYETELTPLNTELTSPYNQTVPYAALGLGVKFKITKRINLNVQTDIKYAFTDYLDDVSTTYKKLYSNTTSEYAANPTGIVASLRGDNNGVNDIYAFTSISLRYNFGKKKYSYQTPVFYSEADKSITPMVTSTQIPVVPSVPTITTTPAVTNTPAYIPTTNPVTIIHAAPTPNLTNPQLIQHSRKDTLVNININYNYGYETNGPDQKVIAPSNTLPPNTTNSYYQNPTSSPATNNQYDELKLEIEKLKLELQKKNASPTYNYVPPTDDKVIVVTTPSPNSNVNAPVDNTAQLIELQKQLAIITAQMEDLKNKPTPIPSNTAPILINTTTPAPTTVIKTYQEEIKNIPPTSIYFATGSSVISQSEKEKLYSVISIYQKYPNETKISIKGFTDGQGNADKNMALSKQRADEVKKLLINTFGINSATIVANYYGQLGSSGSSSNPYGRRVDVEFVK